MSDFSTSGMCPGDLKLMSEASKAARLRKKFGSLVLGDEYSPVLASTNLDSLETCRQIARDVARSGKTRFSEHDWQSTFSPTEGRFSNIYSTDTVDPDLRWAPAGPNGPCHQKCGKCGAAAHFLCAAQYLVPRCFTVADIFDDSSDDDVPDFERKEVGELHDKTKLREWLLKKVEAKRAARAKGEKKENKVKELPKRWIQANVEEMDLIAKKRAAFNDIKFSPKKLKKLKETKSM